MKKFVSLCLVMLMLINTAVFAVELPKTELQAARLPEDENKIPAFPDAEGGGMWTTGARGAEAPEIYHVTNLNDSGEGSFRDAVSQGNRFIVFDVGGNINIESQLEIRADNLTILGQTAPGDGISIDGEGIYLSGNNIIMRYLRIRCGEERATGDAFWATKCENVIVDHCSFSWGMDECVSFTNLKNATLQWCIISEALNKSTHANGQHGYGGIWGGINFTSHHNLLASNNCRNPRIGTGATVSFDYPDTEGVINVRNNVIYNWIYNVAYGGENGVRVNFVGNYYRPGPVTGDKNTIYTLYPTGETSASLPQNGGTTGAGAGKVGWSTTLHVSDNYMEGNDAVNTDNWQGVKEAIGVTLWTKCEEITDGIYVDGVLKPNNQYLDTYPVISQSPLAAYDEVLKYAGASVKRDPIDERVVNDVINRTAPTGTNSGYGMVDFVSDVGGFAVLDGGTKVADTDNDGIADSTEAEYGLDAGVFDSLTIAEDGYTMLEKYAERLAVHEGEESVDKTKLRNLIYKAEAEDENLYTKESWASLEEVLKLAKEKVTVVYQPQAEIDLACENLKNAMNSLVAEDKYDLRVLIDKAKGLNSEMYTAESFLNLQNVLASAEVVYNSANFVQADVDKAISELQGAIDNLELTCKFKLEMLIDDINELNQFEYTTETMDNLSETYEEGIALLENSSATDSEFEAAFNKLKTAYNSLEKEMIEDVNLKFTGDFEQLACFELKEGTYGDYILDLNNSTSRVEKNIGSNKTKALVLEDVASDRINVKYISPEKLRGIIIYECDYYFDGTPNSSTSLVRLFDNTYLESASDGRFFDVYVKRQNTTPYNFCLNIGHLKAAQEDIFLPEATIEKGKWYNLKLIFNTETQGYTLYWNNKKITEGVYADKETETCVNGLNSFAIRTNGGKSETIAVDNISIGAVNQECAFINCKTNGEWLSTGEVTLSGDIVNATQNNEDLILIVASFEDGILVDVAVQKYTVEAMNSIDGASASVKLGSDVSKCNVKAFLWRDGSLEPLMNSIINLY